MHIPNRKVLFWSLIAGGTILRIIQFLVNRSLWLDEASLALNIINRDYSGLLQPLDHNQVAPVLFLLIVKLFSTLPGPGEYGLRLFPLLCSIASLPVFYLLVKKITSDTRIALAALFILAFSSLFIYYSSEFKQYSTDVLCCLVMSYYFVSYVNGQRTAKSLMQLGISVFISIFLSNITVMILAVFSLYFIIEFIRNRKIETRVLLLGFFLGASFLIYYVYFIASHPTEGMMRAYWDNYFMPLNFFSAEFWQWMNKVIVRIFGTLISYYNIKTWWLVIYLLLYSALALAGVISLGLKKRWFSLYILIFPVIVHLLVSALHKYPFNTRLILYLYPLIITLLASGLIAVSDEIKRIGRSTVIPAIFLLLSLIIIPLVLTRIFPFKREEIKESLSYMEENITKDQAIYLYYRARTPYKYYSQTGYFDSMNRLVRGRVNSDDREKFEKDLAKLSGQVWFLFSHVKPISETEDEEVRMVSYLKNDWILLDQFQASGSSVYLLEKKQTVLK
jgi:hypothetical protein